MNTQKLIDRFNEPDTHLVISAWPEKETNHGVAWYTKLTLTELAKRTNSRFVVLAEKGSDNTPHVYQNGRILVLRVFDNSHPSLYPTILTWLHVFNAITNVSIHSEFGVTAGLIHYLLLLPFMALILLSHRRIIYYAHNVIDDITFLLGHLNLTDNPMVVDLINLAIRIHTKLITKLSDRVVVLDETLLHRLKRMLSAAEQKKLTLIPIPLARKNVSVTKTRAKEILGIPPRKKVIVCFGFISAYKGTDWLVNAFAAAGTETNNTQLIIAGGPAHSLKDRSHYLKYHDMVMRQASEHKNITVTGYIPEDKIPLYFRASDLVVLPYRGVMGASGALSHALAYAKPVMLSTSMRANGINDLNTAVKQAHLHGNSVFFDMTSDGMKQILHTVTSAKKLRRIAKFSGFLSKSRDIVKVTASAYNQIYKRISQHEFEKKRLQTIKYFLGFSSS